MLYLLSMFYGLMIGNYLTSAYFRIPRLIPINGINNKLGKAPHCSTCKHKLKFYEYLPLLNWFSTRFKCNYCHAPIDWIYMFLEVTMTVISLILYEIMEMTPEFGLSVLVAASILLNITLFFNYRKIYPKAIFFLLVTGLSLTYLMF